MQTLEAAIETVNPATGAVIARYSLMTDKEAQDCIENGNKEFKHWRTLSFVDRAGYFRRIAELLRERKSQYAELIANEMGKPVTQGAAEIEKCALLCMYYAEHAADYLKDEIVQTESKKSYVTHQPLGIVFGIMPWNFPFWQVFRFAVPAMMAGNTAILKHAPISTGTAIEVEKLFLEAGFPRYAFQTIIVSNETAAEVIAHPHVAAVTFTGSVAAGKIIASEAGRSLKKTVLELGGSDPYLILHDADLELAAEACITSRLANAGQSCVAAKRLIAVDVVRDEFVKILQEKMQRYVVGSPLDEKTTIGPQARKDLRDGVHEQVMKTVKAGATLLAGGKLPDTAGYYYPPTLMTNIPKNSPAYQEEIFGPVLSVISAKDEEEAIQIANETTFGLGGAVFTTDLARGEHIASRLLQAGTCVVNTFVASDPRLPFGGIKNSGYGRELARDGILSFVNIKTVIIK
jgi:succinate-semialdehyde dehydrogenase/glutarate-semialdehyde dehydrogenase